ncbi:hypothetical protein D3C79_368180 [compost metagenome]
MKYKLSDINISHHGKVLVPNIMHFVWIGDANRANMEYIGIWKKQTKIKKYIFGMMSILHGVICFTTRYGNTFFIMNFIIIFMLRCI